MTIADANGWIAIDPKEEPQIGSAIVDIWLPLSGRLADCQWAIGRNRWIRITKRGVEEILATPSHWRLAPPGPVPIGPQRMDIYSKPGTKVVYNDTGGYDAQRENARRFLTKGLTYTVLRLDVGQSHSGVILEEFPNQQFNTVMFWDAATVPSP